MIIIEKNERKKKKKQTTKKIFPQIYKITVNDWERVGGWMGVRAGVEIVLDLLSYYAKCH